MKRLLLPLVLALVSCGGSSGGKDAGTDLGLPPDIPALDLADAGLPDSGPDLTLDLGVPDLASDPGTPDLLPEPEPDLPADPGTPDLLAPDLPVVPEVGPDLPDVPPPECTVPADCDEKLGPAGTCQDWTCEAGKCAKTPLPKGSACDDGDECTTGDGCDGSGFCSGLPETCDDLDGCTVDSCVVGTGCKHDKLGPKDCLDDLGNPGIQECTNGAYGPCVALGPCDLKVNLNVTGTVNPYIWPARNGLFYVSYVASEDGGGNLKLAWVDRKTCAVVAGPFTVNDKPGGVYYWGAQAVVSDVAGNFYAVWEAANSGSHVAFAASESGDAFGPAVDVISTSENGVYPSLAVIGIGKVAVAWSGYWEKKEYDPFLTLNPAVFGGGTFSTAVQVAATKVQDDATAIAADSYGNLYVAWESFDDGTEDGGNLYVAKSTDGGKTFSPKVRVNDVPGKAGVDIGNFLAWGKDRLYVVWQDTRTDSEGDIYLDSSADGVTFGTDVRVNDDTYRTQEDPSVAVGLGKNCAGEVYVVWQDLRSNNGYDIFGTRSTDGGQTFEKNVALNPSLDGDQMNPALTVDYGCVTGVAWRDSAANPKFDVRATFTAVLGK